MMQKPTNIRWHILALLCLSSFVSYTLRANISTAAPFMIEDLALTEIQWGWVLAAFTTGYALFQLPGGVYGDTIGPRRALTTIAVLWGVFTLLTALVPGQEWGTTTSLAVLIVVRFLVGVFHAPVFPVQNASIQRWFPPGNWAFPSGLSSTGLTLGVAITTPILVWLIMEIGWRYSFVALTPLSFIVAVLWWWYSKDHPEQHPHINAEEAALIKENQQAVESSEDVRLPWILVLKNRDILLLTISYFCMTFVFYEVFSWFFYYLVEIRGFEAQQAGYLTASQWVCGAIGAALGGWICDKLCHRIGLRWGCRWPAIIGMLLSAVLLIVGALSSDPYIAMFLFVFCFLFNQMTEGAYWATTIAIGGRYAGTAAGVMNTGGNISGVIGALLIPFTANLFGWTFAIATGGIFAIAGAGLWFFIRVDQPLIEQTS
jgi:ACS family glucarate transporter-like MFS transporter